jgi:hypothetical protein
VGICADNNHAGLFPAGGQVVTEARQPKWSREETRARDEWFWHGDNCHLMTREDFDEMKFCRNYYNEIDGVNERLRQQGKIYDEQEALMFAAKRHETALLLIQDLAAIIRYINDPAGCGIIKEFLATYPRLPRPAVDTMLASGEHTWIWLLMQGRLLSKEDLLRIATSSHFDAGLQLEARDLLVERFNTYSHAA